MLARQENGYGLLSSDINNNKGGIICLIARLKHEIKRGVGNPVLVAIHRDGL
jgi:hypothetical protein